jgi:hypothetical protein
MIEPCYTPKDPGLGDFISTIQYCQSTDKRFMTHWLPEYRCTISMILSLFENDITLVESCDKPISVRSHWWHTDYLPYVKSNLLDNFKKKDYITVSLISTGETIFEHNLSRRLHKSVLRDIFQMLSGEKLINLSSYEISQVDNLHNKCSDSICEKFKWLASAKLNISTDTGTAHLAAMTDTPTIVIGPPVTWNRYNGNDNIHFVTKLEDLKKVYYSLINKVNREVR